MMVDLIFDFLKQIYHLSEKVIPVLLPLGAVIIFALKGKIKLYFQKNLLEDKEKYKKELEFYKSSLLRELEEHKLGIDVRKYLSLEMSKKRLMAYQNLMEAVSHFRNLAWRYNIKPDAENRDNIFGKDVEKGWRFLNTTESNVLFFSSGALSQFKTQIGPCYQKVLNSIADVKPIDKEDLKNLDAGLKKVKEYLLSEIFPDDPVS